MTKRLHTWGICLFAAVLLITGQDIARAQKAKLKVRLLAERIPPNLGKVTLANEDIQSDPFNLPMNNLSAPQEPPARAFRIQTINKNIPLATVKLPEEGNSFVVILLPNAEGLYTPIIMPFNGSKFKPGDAYIHNNTPKTVLGFIGTAKFSLRPKRGTVITLKGARKERFYDVGLGVREDDGTNRMIKSTRWPEDKQARFYVFYYVDPKPNASPTAGWMSM